jgi:sulfur carrier protein
MNVTVNGETKNITKASSVLDLLAELDLTDAFVAVAVNSSCITRSQYDQTDLKENDKIEILAPMAGG